MERAPASPWPAGVSCPYCGDQARPCVCDRVADEADRRMPLAQAFLFTRDPEGLARMLRELAGGLGDPEPRAASG